MKIRTIAMAAAALSLAASPAIAEAAFDRASAPIEGESEVQGSGILLAVLAAAAVVGGLVVIADDNNSVSP